uniref:Ig-like domain-containing protein n=1 Tax=Anas platyrhynchos TaxID=8839 RepID=A0A8B9ZAY5_ANAPL
MLQGDVARSTAQLIALGIARGCCREECLLQGVAQGIPQVRIIPAEKGKTRVPVRLSCHIWGFYPPEVTIIWLHNGDILQPDDYNPISAIPNSDWSYQTQVSLLVAPVAGDTYTCSVQHVSLQEPLLEDWTKINPNLGGKGGLQWLRVHDDHIPCPGVCKQCKQRGEER